MVTRFPTLTRRDFLRVGGVGVAGYSLLPMLQATNLQSPAAVTPRGGAEICIFIMLQGAPSQMDTFDAKLNRETPEDFDIRTIRDGVRMPVGTLPLLTERLDKYAIIRSMEFWEKDHNRGTYYIQAGRPEPPSRMKEVPSFGAVLAYESLNQRRDTDFLPPYISLNVRTDLLVANGLLPPSCSPMSLNARVKPPFVLPDSERETFKVRRELLKQLELSCTRVQAGTRTHAATDKFKLLSSLSATARVQIHTHMHVHPHSLTAAPSLLKQRSSRRWAHVFAFNSATLRRVAMASVSSAAPRGVASAHIVA